MLPYLPQYILHLGEMMRNGNGNGNGIQSNGTAMKTDRTGMKRWSGKRLNPLGIVVAGTAIALGIGGYLGYRLARGPAVGPVDMPTGVELLPPDTVMAMTVTTHEGQWKRLRGFGTLQSRSQFDQQLVRWRDRFLTDNGLNYKRDIQPWVGDEATLAILPLDSEAKPEPSPDASATPDATAPLPEGFLDPNQPLPLVVVLPIADGGKAQQVLSRAAIATGQQVQTRDYQGFSIREVDGEGDQDYAATVLENKYAVVSNQAIAVERVINTYKAGASLRDVGGYREAIADSTLDQPFLRLYLSGPEVRQVVAANTAQPVPLLGITPVQRNQGVAASLALESNGLRILGANWLAADSETRYTVANDAGELPEFLPEEVLLLLSGGDFQQFWESYRQNAVANPASPLNPTTFEQGINRLTSLNWNDDLLTWMDGEFALALIPLPNPAGTPQMGMVLMVQTSDRTAAEAVLKKLDGVMGDRYQFQVSTTELDGQSIVNWVSPFGSLAMSHGWIDDKTVFLTLGTGTVNRVLPTPQTPLKENVTFKTTDSDVLTAYDGRVFVDVAQLQNYGANLPLPPLPPGAAIVTESLQQIGLTSAIRSDRTSRFDLHLRIRKDGEALPFP